MTIVCATRFTEESSYAVKVAADLARKHQQPLWLVHVLPSGGLKPWADRLDAAATTTLEHEVQDLGRHGVTAQFAILHGKVEQELGRFCAEKQAALLVVGDTSRSLGQLRTGVLDRLSASVAAPMLVVRDPRPLQAWATGAAPLKVMLAMDHGSGSAVARDWIIRLSEYGPINLVATHVWWPREELERRNLPPTTDAEALSALGKVIRTEMASELNGLPASVKHRLHVEHGEGRIGDQLLALAGEEQVDVLVLGTHQRRGLGRLLSVAHRVLAEAPMSVACIPGRSTANDLAAVPSFHTALVATDLSDHGNRAIAWALGVVGHGTVHVAHVTPEPYSPERERAILKRLEALLPPGAEAGGARVMFHVFHGDVVPSLLKANDSLAVDVICLGVNPALPLKSQVVTEMMMRSGRPVLLPPAVRS